MMEKDWWKEYLSEDGRELDLSETNLTSLKGVNFPDGLQVLCLSYTNLTSLEGTDLPSGLQKLGLASTNLTSLEGVEFPSGLQMLDLSRANLTSLEGVEFPTGLQMLVLSHTNLTSLEGVNLPSGLQVLILSGANLISWNGVKLPAGLQHLALGDTNLTSLDGVELPSELQVLHLSDTELESLSGVEFPRGLQWLDLDGTGLMSLSGVVLPEGLKRLNLSRMYLTSLAEVKFPESLLELDLKDMYLTSLAGLKLPTGLQKLNLSGMRLTSLAGLELPVGLQELDLSLIMLVDLPDSIQRMRELRRLALSNQELTELPEWVLQLIPSEMEPISLPDSIQRMKNLRWLNLSDLELKELPDWLPELGLPFSRWGGDSIRLNGTTVEGVDMSIFDQPQEVILQWFEERKRLGMSRLNEIKVVFLGNGDVGKTHTIARLMKDGEKPDSAYTGESTPGIAISDHTYTMDGEAIKVHFWDFGGQEIFYSMHRMFLTERTIYVVMVNARDEKRGVQTEKWLDTVKSFAPKAPVLLAVNKLDENPGIELDEPKLREEHSNLKTILYMSARDFDREAFHATFTEAMLALIRKSEVPKEKWPSNWKKVKDALRDMEEPYIRGREYEKLCRDCDVEQGGELLLNWCNDLGVCYRREDRRLKDYVILRPEWITNAVYTILSNKWDRVRNGILPLEDIFDLLTSEKSRQVLKNIPYSWSDMDYILGVVRRFSLSYSVDADQEFFPMLCSEKSSEVVKDYVNREGVLEFHMEFPYLPNNVLHRLMVERHGELDSEHVWRTGARFRQIDTGLSAVVRMDDKRLKLYVRSDSELHAPNTYLSLIAGHVERICGNLNLEIGSRWVVYKEGNERVEFDYDDLRCALEDGEREIRWPRRRNKKVPLKDILKLSGYGVDREREKLLEDLVWACEKLQDDNTTWDKSEDARTIYLRNLLQGKGYIASCQEPGGVSAGGKRAGEQDLVIQKEPGRKWTILEALNLNSSAPSYRSYWNDHLKKLLDSYNATGCPFLLHVTYLSCEKDRFDLHCDEFDKHIPRYSPDGFPVTSERVRYPLWDRTGGFTRVMECTYDCGGLPMTVYHFFVRIGS